MYFGCIPYFDEPKSTEQLTTLKKKKSSSNLKRVRGKLLSFWSDLGSIRWVFNARLNEGSVKGMSDCPQIGQICHILTSGFVYQAKMTKTDIKKVPDLSHFAPI